MHEQRRILDVEYLSGRHLSHVQRESKDVCVWLSDVNEAGGHEEVDALLQLERSNSIGVQFARFVADDYDL